MNSCIYQIQKGVSSYDADNRIDEGDFYEHLEDIPADYVGDAEEEEESYINDLPNILPPSMFKCNGREVTFLGPDKAFLEKWKQDIIDTASNISVDELIKHDSWNDRSELNMAVNNVLDTSVRFYDEDCYVKQSTEFVFDCLRMKPGEKFYIGAVVKYHF